jgi:hypothetical protein
MLLSSPTGVQKVYVLQALPLVQRKITDPGRHDNDHEKSRRNDQLDPSQVVSTLSRCAMEMALLKRHKRGSNASMLLSRFRNLFLASADATACQERFPAH